MADTKLSALTELAATPAVDDELYIRDISEAAADESKRITVANLKAANSSARAYASDIQVLSDSEYNTILLDNENWDIGSDFDVTVKTGAADDTEANKLHDADGGFEAGDVGAQVWNTTDNTYALVTAFVDAGELTLDTDIMVNGENYKLFRSWFVAPADGKYLVTGTIQLSPAGASKRYSACLHVNGNVVVFTSNQAATTGATLAATATSVLDLSVNDKVQLKAFQEAGQTTNTVAGTWATFLAIHGL